MSDKGDTEDPPRRPDDAGSNSDGQDGRDSVETANRDTASRDNLSSEAFGQGSNSFKQSLESMGQSLKKGTETAMAQFGQLTLFDSKEGKKEGGQENAEANKQEKKEEKKESKKDEKKEELDEDESLLRDLNDPVKQAQRKKEAAEREAKEKKEFDEKAEGRKPPKDGEPLDTEASKEGTKDYLKKLPDLDYKNVLKDHKVTLLGEHHKDNAAKEHVAEYAKNMKDAGATHFAVEMIPQKMQPTLDKFMKGDKEARKEIQDYLNKTWDQSYPGTGEKYMKMLDAVKDSGLKIVGMDINGHIDKGEKGRTERDQAWANSISNILKNDPNAKVVAYGGSAHFERNTAWTKSTNELLKDNHKIDSQVLNLSGLPTKPTDRHDESLRQNEHNPLYRLSEYGRQAGQDGRSIHVPLAPKGSDTKYDGFIFLPRKQK